MPYLNALSDDAASIGAVNTVAVEYDSRGEGSSYWPQHRCDRLPRLHQATDQAPI